MAHARFTATHVKSLCDSALRLNAKTRDDRQRRAERIQLLHDFASAAHGLSGEVFLTTEDFADLREAWLLTR